ncbi:pilus assembly protein TadG-related protein [Brevundimonas sp.]|uniref:pilus assembly protein TadG-related protein n=1 Tax=Brevundimonas sp. TaxID=1871086 RepID=UPI0025BF7CBF|nr:pilus assembly protein TadG-related protein [Brevundimonas sp.]
MAIGHWISGIARGACNLVRRMASETRGNVAMIFGLSMPVLVLMTVGGVDIHRASTVRVNLQDALDAATLAAARSPYSDDVNIQRVGLAALKANLKAYPNITLREADTTFVLNKSEIVVASSKVDVKTLVANIFLPPYGKFMDDYIQVGAHSEVNRATKDIEVSLVLDITGSMEGTRLSDLQEAANDLVDLVVQTNQSINKTRMALVPYSMGVNAGSYLNDVRGAARGATNITGAAWMVANSQKTITAMTKASPGVFTANSHGYSTGDFVWISGVTDGNNSGQADLASYLNGKSYKVVRIDNNTFSLQTLAGSAINTTGYQTYTASSGIARRCLVSTCEVVVTSNGHGLATGEDVRMLNVGGMTQLNTQNSVSPSGSTPFYQTVTKQTDSTFSINNMVGPVAAVSNYTSGGTVQCLEYGCANFLFTNNENNLRIFEASSCVSERVGSNAYTDAAPSTSKVAFSYVGTTNVGQGGCMTTTFTPLTTNRDTLHSRINAYKAEGGTAGQIGVGWGWYMVSPTFASIFPTESTPDPYGTPNLLKVVIIMTDGEFNAVYYNGVRARDSGAGGGSNDRWINHNSNNGSPFLQSVNMCNAMKAQNIIIYTVGFDISGTPDTTPGTVDTATEVMQACATSPDYVYLPQNGSSLKTAFAAIGRSISQLRISK